MPLFGVKTLKNEHSLTNKAANIEEFTFPQNSGGISRLFNSSGSNILTPVNGWFGLFCDPNFSMKQQRYFIIDFDSTFTKVEAFDVLAGITLRDHPDKNRLAQQVADITNLGMSGELSFRESLEQRLALIAPERKHLPVLIQELKKLVSDSFRRNREFFQTHSSNIYIISNGFREFIEPVVCEYGILPENIIANTFEFDEQGKVTGFDRSNPLSANNGKVEQIRRLNLPGDVYVIGDGYTDYEIKQSGLANKFYAFTENVERTHVTSKADHVAPSLDEFLFLNKLNTAISYPKNRIQVL